MSGAGATERSGRVSVLCRFTEAPLVGCRVGRGFDEVNGNGASSKRVGMMRRGRGVGSRDQAERIGVGESIPSEEKVGRRLDASAGVGRNGRRAAQDVWEFMGVLAGAGWQGDGTRRRVRGDV
jgi:hypothetical protein